MTEKAKIADRAEYWFNFSDKKWYVRTVSDNNEIILVSEGYDAREHAIAVAEDTGLPVREYFDRDVTAE